MQTFLICSDFTENAKVLDNKRLGKQRVECLQILFILYAKKMGCVYIKANNDNQNEKTIVSLSNKIYTNCIENASKTKNGIPKKIGHLNHPIIEMWNGYEKCLFDYMQGIIKEWTARGYKDTTLNKASAIIEKINDKEAKYPEWIKDEKLHNSHKSNLLKKDKQYYSKFNWGIEDNLEYIWVKE